MQYKISLKTKLFLKGAIKMSLGTKIRTVRKEKKLTQIDLANQLGVDNVTLSDYERDKTMPSLAIFKMLCKVLSLDANELLDLIK